MSRIVAKGAVDQTIYVEILDSASTTGGRKTGIVYNSAGLTAYYVRNGASATAITLATLAAANSAHSDGGFKEVDATNMPGVYRLDLPDAAVASGADSVVVTIKGASGAAQVSAEIQLTGINAQNATTGGLGNLDVASSTLATASALSAVAGYIDTEVAAIKAKTDNLPASPAATGDIPTAVQNADALLGRNVAGGSNGTRTVAEALYVLRNKVAISGGTLTVYGTDDATPAFTATVATAAGDPISSIDPA